MVFFSFTLPQDFLSLTEFFFKLPCSGGIVSHSFELEAKEKGIFNGAPAVVTFRVPTKAALQVGHMQS